MLIHHNSIHVPCGLGTTICLSEKETDRLLLKNDHRGRGCDYDSDCHNPLTFDNAVNESDNDCSITGQVDNSESLLMDLKLMYYEIVNIVESDPALQKVALMELSALQNKVTRLFAKKVCF